MTEARRTRPGTHFMMGNQACAEGILAAGCSFAAGYPITPASEILNALAGRLPRAGGTLLQSEDEIGAICAVIGASWAGCKALTCTSGPGISLMQENIGFAVATETPLVIVDVQRLGPSTGVPSVGLAGDMVQVARGSHGDYQIIALCPESPQEMFDLTIRAFNLAETYRVPVFLMADAFVAHMRERVTIPSPEAIRLSTRRITAPGTQPMERQDFLDPEVAAMPVFGRGLQAHVTSSCHDEHGMRNLSDPEVMHRFITRPVEKILAHRDRIVQVEGDPRDSDLVMVAYGTVARAAKAAAELARAAGYRVDVLRLITCWPLPDREIRRAAENTRYLLVLENNLGQLYPYIRAEAAHACPVDFLGPQLLGQIHDPHYILARIEETLTAMRSAMRPAEHPLRKYMRPHVQKTTTCPGCGNGIVAQAILRAIDELGLALEDFVFVSGIGCSAWIPSPLFAADTLHTTHGRPVAFATGVKLGLPEKHVLVASGDGDLCAIGGNHLIHAARRNIDLTVVLVNNGIYAMTGGQTAPTTPRGIATITHPFGSLEHAFDISALVRAAGAAYVARWTTAHPRQLKKAIQEAIRKKGFSLVEALSQCPVQYGRAAGLGKAADMLRRFRENSIQLKQAQELPSAELAGRIVVGTLADEEKPELASEWARLQKELSREEEPWAGPR